MLRGGNTAEARERFWEDGGGRGALLGLHTNGRDNASGVGSGPLSPVLRGEG